MSNFVTLFDETIRQSTQSKMDVDIINKEFIKVKLIKGNYYKLYIKVKHILSGCREEKEYIKCYVILFDKIIGLEYDEQNDIILKTLINSNIEEHSIYKMLKTIKKGIKKQDIEYINWDINIKDMLLELNYNLIQVFDKIISQQMLKECKESINLLDITNEN